MKFIATALLGLFYTTLCAQNTTPNTAGTSLKAGGMFYTDVSGMPYRLQQQSELVSGSPFYNDGWMKGRALLKNGDFATVFQARLNLLSGDVHYLTAAGEEFVTTLDVKELLLTDTTTGTTAYFVHLPDVNTAKGKNHWYQVISSGAVTGYKSYRKNLIEEKQYGAATIERRISTNSIYLLKQNNSYTEFKNVKELLLLLPLKRAELETYLRTNDNKSLPPDVRISGILDYYNTLMKQ